MNSIATITLAGQQVGLKFGLPAVRRFFEKTAQYQLMAGNMYTELGVAHILYAGYLNYCIMLEQPPILEFQPFYELVEDLDDPNIAKQIAAATKAFEESKYVKRMVEAVDDEKKKATMMTESQSTGTESNLSASENSDIPRQNIAG